MYSVLGAQFKIHRCACSGYVRWMKQICVAAVLHSCSTQPQQTRYTHANSYAAHNLVSVSLPIRPSSWRQQPPLWNSRRACSKHQVLPMH